MFQEAITIGLALILGSAALAVAFVLGMRAKAPWAQRPIIWLSKAVINKRQLRTAGSPGAYAAIVRHRGRSSGRSYETPIGTVADGDAFLVALPYGTRSQWLRNVLAAGSATLVHEGQTFAADRPEIVPMEGLEDRFSAADQRSHRLFNVDRCLRLRRVVMASLATDPAVPTTAPEMRRVSASPAIGEPRT